MIDQTFRRFADDYNFWIQHQPDPEGFTRIAKLARGLERVLDVGCGDGLLTVELARVAHHVVGVDLSPTMIDRARQRAADAGCQNVEFIQADINALEMAQTSFDLIVSSFALHHTDPRMTVPALVGLLRPGGVLYVQEPVCPVTGPWARRLWYRRQGLHDLPAIVQRHGWQTAWRVTRFRQSRTWIEHQIQDDHWTPAAARACYQSLLPGAIIHEAPTADILQVMWQRPLAQEEPITPQQAPPHQLSSSPAVPSERPISVGRTYPCPAPAGYTPFPRTALDGSVIARFEEQVKRHEAKSAVCTATQQLSYGDLNSTANQWARRLLGCAAAVSAPVAILMDQDDPVIPAIFGTLKAGKAYVVIDPADPPERQSRILALTGATSLLTTAARVQQAGQWQPAPQQILVAEEISHDPDQGNLELPLGPDQLAAIFFTSGSTGEPKGIARDHRQFLHSTWLNTNTYYVAPEDRQSLLYFPGFTASVPNIYDTLLNGATLCSLNPRHLTATDLLAWLQREAISHFNPPIGLFRGLLEAVTPAMTWPNLRLITLGGQPLYGKDIRDFQTSFGTSTVLLYVLAMTEAGAITQGYIDHQTVAGEGPVPVGYPVADKQITIVDEAGEPVLPGTVGQLMVTSPYLSLGQWEEVRAVTQQAPFRLEVSQPRRFLTSDRGRFRDDGALEFYGRADAVVKLRGYRVDLGAIETVLNSLPAIQTAVVAAVPMLSGEKRLVAYVVPQPGCEPNVNDLKQALRQQLPRYMMPEHFEVVAHLPLTASGKIDRQALLRPGQARPELSTPYVAPRNPTEAQLAELWAEVLELDEVGIEDNFFDLGGDSLLTLRLISQIEANFQQTLSLPHFMAKPTIAQVASQLADAASAVTADPPSAAEDGPTPLMDARLQAIYDEISCPGGRSSLYHKSVGSKRPMPSRLGQMLQQLPYGARIGVLHWLVHQPGAQQRFWQPQIQLIRRFHAVLNTAVPESAMIANSLFYGLQHQYRLNDSLFKTTPKAQLVDRFIQMEGDELLAQARQQGGGVILTCMHTVAAGWFRRLQWFDYMIGNFDGVLKQAQLDQPEVKALLRARQIQVGQQSLQKGMVVGLAPDGYLGDSAGTVRTFHGRQRLFFTGFAELALLTSAPVLLALAEMHPGQKVRFQLVEPLDTGGAAMSHAARVEHLMNQYLVHLDQLWRTSPWMIPWRQMEQHLACPVGIETNV